jgi:hypothetical protein
MTVSTTKQAVATGDTATCGASGAAGLGGAAPSTRLRLAASGALDREADIVLGSVVLWKLTNWTLGHQQLAYLRKS